MYITTKICKNGEGGNIKDGIELNNKSTIVLVKLERMVMSVSSNLFIIRAFQISIPFIKRIIEKIY